MHWKNNTYATMKETMKDIKEQVLKSEVINHDETPMYVNKKQVPMVNYIYGIGGRDTKSDDIESVFKDLQEIAKTGEIDNPYRYLGLRK